MHPTRHQHLRDAELGAFSVDEWCVNNNVCRSSFYNLLKKGLAPRSMKIGKRRIITYEANREWRRRMEELPPEAD